MPTMAAITAKNAAAANVTFDVVTPAQGDGTPAIWAATSLSGTAIGRPYATMISRWNASKNARKVIPSLIVPYTITDPTTGLVKVVANVEFRNGEMTSPSTVPDTFKADAVAYWQSLSASTLWKECFLSGYTAS